MARLELEWKDYLLWTITALISACARYLAQYGYFPWKKGLFAFLIAVFIHYILLMFVFIGTYAVLYFFRFTTGLDIVDNRLMRTVLATVLAVSVWVIWVYFMRGNSANDPYDEDLMAAVTPLMAFLLKP